MLHCLADEPRTAEARGHKLQRESVLANPEPRELGRLDVKGEQAQGKSVFWLTASRQTCMLVCVERAKHWGRLGCALGTWGVTTLYKACGCKMC